MKITAFNPQICTLNAKNVTELFEALGFEHAHVKSGINDSDIVNFDMKHPDGFRVDVAEVAQRTQDLTAIRMNVQDFDEAFELLTAHGFKNAPGVEATEAGGSKQTMMLSPSGFALILVEHIKN